LISRPLPMPWSPHRRTFPDGPDIGSTLPSRKIGLKIDGIGGHTALYYWPSAMIREYAALVKHYLVPYLFGLAIMLAMQFYFMWIIVP